MMRKGSSVIGWAILAVAWLVADGGPAPAEPAGSPAITPQQIEAEWFHTDEVRRKGRTQRPGASHVTPELDAAGGVDGVIDGKWGFHTQNEANPWWQVDLGEPTAVERIVLYNRCDSCGERNTRIIVRFSDDGREFTQVYQHNGTMFFGHTDKKPLVVPLGGKRTRYVRLGLDATEYFHLDEVQIFAPGSDENIALGKPATQSSTSQWSALHGRPAGPKRTYYDIATVIERGRKLAESQRRLGANVDAHVAALDEVAARLEKLPENAPEPIQRELYVKARWAVRRMTLGNPLLDFDTILFAKRVPPMFPHMSDQFYGWWSRPGGGIYLLEGFKGERPRVRCLTEDWPEGSFLRPDLSYDARKVLFAYCRYYPHVAGIGNKVLKEDLPEDAFYHLFEMDLATGEHRRLTHGRYDDFDGRYLPDGRIVFLSTRKGTSLQTGKYSAAASCAADQPDCYVRCGGGNSRPVAVFTLHRIDADGGNLCAISAFENFEWTPAIAADGRILYARWDYIDRFNGPFISLWSTNPDGGNAQLVYGNFTARPQCVFEARPVPGSNQLVFTASAHHSNTGGSLCLLDRTRGTEFARPITRLTPEVPFPETEAWADMYYANPWPLSEEYFLVSFADRRLPGHSRMDVDDPRNPKNASAIYLYDAFGNLELLHRDPEISSMYPIPVRPRPLPPAMPELTRWEGPQEGRFLVQDVGAGLETLPPGTVKRIRIVGVPPKVQPQMNSPVLGVSREDPGKFVLGTVPVEADGSAYFRVPSGVPVLFQALDANGRAVQTMRSLTYVQPGQTLTCIGCHEHRDLAPPLGRVPVAMTREPSRLTLDPPGSWPLDYAELVQPALEKHCVSCHRPDGKDPKAARFDLTAAKSYNSLTSYADKDIEKLAFEKDRSIPGQCVAANSKLMAMLTGPDGHEGVRLDPDSHARLVTWLDTYAQRQGHFSPEQAEKLRAFREELAGMLTQ